MTLAIWISRVDQDESNLIVVYDSFYMLLESVCWCFVEDFCIYIHQRYWPVIFFFVSVGFWYQGDGGFIVWLWEFSFLFNLLEEFEKDRYKFFFVCGVEFPSEAIWFCFQAFLKLEIIFLFWWSICWNYVFFLIQFW